MQSNAQNFIPLEALQVASLCRADWNLMQGDDRARFCQSCAKHVYHLSGMTRAEAEQLIRSHEGEICIRLSRRADGTVITDNCPVGLRATRNASCFAGRIVLQPVRWAYSTIAVLLPPLLLVGATTLANSASKTSSCQSVSSRLRQMGLVRFVLNRFAPEEPIIMGAMQAPMPPAFPSPTPPQAATPPAYPD